MLIEWLTFGVCCYLVIGCWLVGGCALVACLFCVFVAYFGLWVACYILLLCLVGGFAVWVG